MSFSPALGTHNFVRLDAGESNSSSTLHFTYSASSQAASHDNNNEPTPELWTNLPSGQWQAVPFLSHSASSTLFVAKIELDSNAAGSFEFTFRLNHGDGNLQWLGSEGSNGRVDLVRAAYDTINSDEHPCPFSFEGGDDNVVIEQASTGVILASFKLRKGKSGQIQSFRLKRDQQDVEHAIGLVLERSERTWITPRELSGPHCISSLSDEYDASMLYLRASPNLDSPFPQAVLVLPVSTSAVCCSIRGGQDSVWLRCTRDTPNDDVQGHVVVAWGQDGQFQQLLDKCKNVASNVIKRQDRFWSELQNEFPPVNDDDNDELQGLTVCTWNALNYDHYKLEDVLHWLDGLLDPKQTRNELFSSSIDTVLLDDGWQDTEIFLDVVDQSKNRRAIKSFGAKREWLGEDLFNQCLSNEQKNEEEVKRKGLGLAVEQIKMKGISKVGVWMTLEGYWDAISPFGPLSKQFNLEMWQIDTRLPKFAEGDTHWFFPRINQIESYFKTYFETLKSCGIDFVKIDDQAHQDYVVEPDNSNERNDSGLLRQEMLKRMRQVSNQVFGTGTTINCMAGSPRIWNGPLALVRTGHRSIVRNSDDYFPDSPDSHPWHIYVNAYNTWFTSQLELVPDFDMCQERTTDTNKQHPWGSYHIAFRAFSPAQTFSTDVPGHLQNEQGWNAMLAKVKHGKGRRPIVSKLVKTTTSSGLALEHRLGHSDVLGAGQGECLRVGLNLMKGTRGGHLGMWNTRRDGATAVGTIDELDVFDVVKDSSYGRDKDEDGSFVIELNGHVVEVSGNNDFNNSSRLLAAPLLHVTLEQRQFAIATIAQVYKVDLNHDTIKIACLGLMDKHTGLAAISHVSNEQAQSLTESIKAVSPVSSSSSPPRSPPPPYWSPPSSERKIEQQTTIVPQNSLTVQPGTTTTRSNFPKPHPQSRLANLIYTFTLSSSSSSTTNTIEQRHSTLSSLSKDLIKRPLQTLLFELTTLTTFSLAIMFWSFVRLGQNLLQDRRSDRIDQVDKSRQGGESGRGTPVVRDEKPLIHDQQDQQQQRHQSTIDQTNTTTLTKNVFACHLLTTSSKLGFWIQSSKHNNERQGDIVDQIRIYLDHELICSKYVTVDERQCLNKGQLILVNVDKAVEELKGSRDDTLSSDYWLLQVGFASE
ncbi:hypothetical protein OIO90_005214 [Microbotryomycetes sp. JL221]|nr:hypothetical protein OIO90_005214 [Microbotryomycetes sp. JL221]